jgi:hypothetical protein
MDVFDDNEEWKPAFLKEPAYCQANEDIMDCMKALVAKGYSIRDVSHALIQDIMTAEVTLVMRRTRGK